VRGLAFQYNERLVVTAKRAFGISSHLFHNERLTREHLLAVGAHGFDRLELFATRTHFDYHNRSVVADLQQWLTEAGLQLLSVHAPVGESFERGRWGPPYNLASPDEARRMQAVKECERAIRIARRIPFRFLVTHIGVTGDQADQNSRSAARKSVEALHRLAEPLDVRVAIEVIPNELSRSASLVHFVEDVIEAPGLGICLDFGHAHMGGDLIEAIETVSEHVIATHVHDNRGRTDDHLAPFEGTIDWAGALTAVQKVGYDDTLLFELAAHGSVPETLRKAVHARERIERMLSS